MADLHVRLPDDLQAELRIEAERQGVSLNQLIATLLAGGLGWQPGSAKGKAE
jgi:predicted HicB family RNase H-like nuclease